MDPQNQALNMNVAPSPFAPATPTPSKDNGGTNHKKVGPTIVIFIIIVTIIFLATYLFASNSNKQQQIPTNDSSIAAKGSVNASQAAIGSQVDQSGQTVQPITNTGDDLQSLQNDLNNSTTGVDNQNF